jgi:uncharacterized protein YabE (DUF348 family)
MTEISFKTVKQSGVLVALIALIGLFISVAMFQTTRAQNDGVLDAGEHVITVHDDGAEKGFYTKAATLGEALKEAGVDINDFDRTEPELSEELVAASYEVNVYRARPVIVRDGASETKIITSFRTGKQIAEQAGIQLYDEDIVALSPAKDIISEGAAEVMTIARAVEFTLDFYGKSSVAHTQAETVGDMMVSRGIKLAQNDRTQPSLDTPISAGMNVKIWREGKQTVTQEEPVKFTTEKIKDADREVGYKEVKTPGKDGKRTVTYEVLMQNGLEVSRVEINATVVEQPVQQVEIIGTKFSNTFSGSFAEALARLRSCEGSYTSNTGNGYYGAYQYDIQTWGGYQGYANASLAPPAVQDQKVWETYQRRGWQPWPSCKIKMGLQDIYR